MTILVTITMRTRWSLTTDPARQITATMKSHSVYQHRGWEGRKWPWQVLHIVTISPVYHDSGSCSHWLKEAMGTLQQRSAAFSEVCWWVLPRPETVPKPAPQGPCGCTLQATITLRGRAIYTLCMG